MTTEFRPAEIDPKWRARWTEQDLYRTPEPSDRPTFYCLDFFPYPSGDGISVGHLRNYVPTDVISRVMRMRGYDVLHPMGWDAFGLPTENAAIETGRHPADLTREWSANYKRQLDLAGGSYDWAREINSTHPQYYRWTQWMFLKLYQRGLAYRASGLQWWCPICGALANEEVNADGTDWRDHTRHHPAPAHPVVLQDHRLRRPVDRRPARAGLARRDARGPDQLDRPQRGRGRHLRHRGRRRTSRLLTTRPDTLFGATFMVLAPEHPLVSRVTSPERVDEVRAYAAAAARKAELERVALDDDKTGVFTGGYAVNPVNNERLPIWIADYVLMSYGSGAIMAVPAHDQRDFDFATRYGIEIRTVIAPPDWDGQPLTEAFVDDGPMVNSGQFDGLSVSDGGRAVTKWLSGQGKGDGAVNYKLRDWLISRQRYWGTPIPIVHCHACGEVPVPEDQLPLLLPYVEQIDPRKLGGRSPLEVAEDWVNTTCPDCGAEARRETDTLGGFACSSWYFLRFCSPDQHEQAFDPDAIRRWMPVDLYVGGAEHSVMHLLYARFWTKALRDAGVLDLGEPFQALRHQGLMLAQPGWVDEAALRIDSQGGARVAVPDGADAFDSPDAAQPFRRYPLEARFELTGQRAQRNGTTLVEFRITKMSKSWRNVVTPDEVAANAGGDALRCYTLFMGPFDRTLPWSDQGLAGVSRWLSRVWNVVLGRETGGTRRRRAAYADVQVELQRRLHQTIRRVSNDIDALKFNTMIAALMEFTNFLIEVGDDDLRATPAWRQTIETFLVLLAPSTVFMAEELWERTGHDQSIHLQSWPAWDEALAADETFTLVVQVNGRVRDRIQAPVTIDEAAAHTLALASPRVQAHTDGRQLRKVIYRQGRLINLVVA